MDNINYLTNEELESLTLKDLALYLKILTELKEKNTEEIEVI